MDYKARVDAPSHVFYCGMCVMHPRSQLLWPDQGMNIETLTCRADL